MSEFLTKQTEWQQQAESSDDLKLQVGRPQSDESWQLLAKDVVEKLKLHATDNLLDVGCGSGLLLSKLATNCAYVSGIDYAQAMVDKAQALLPNAQFYCGEAKKLPFASRSFDKLLSYSIFHYFPDREYALSVVKEMIRVVKPGGIILIGDVLDANYENEIKSKSNLAYEQKIPNIHRYSQWQFYDFVQLERELSDLVSQFEVLTQPNELALSGYRKDIRLWL
ncbi:class I SAM-dependent methyltransferase [Pseudoalteromonas sp.]|uniref:class I SAM-dependent methyltransferase n=1 Tax=Pseudoalteromonas sp. TaxID=53249 RepID=UPI0035629BF2